MMVKKPSVIRLPLRFGNIDAEVQQFIEEEFWNIGPYTNPVFVRSAQQVFERALFLFGDERCDELFIWHH